MDFEFYCGELWKKITRIGLDLNKGEREIILIYLYITNKQQRSTYKENKNQQ